MSNEDEQRLWQLQFGVEVSTRYHDWRRSRIGGYVTVVRAVALAGAIISLLAVHTAGAGVYVIVTGASITIAAVTLVDLVFKFDDLARSHTDLYQRFKRLQADIALGEEHWRERIFEWEAQAQDIRSDEPPVFWAIYAMCWNQTAERNGISGHSRKVPWLFALLSGVLRFQPKQFPIDRAEVLNVLSSESAN